MQQKTPAGTLLRFILINLSSDIDGYEVNFFISDLYLITKVDGDACVSVYDKTFSLMNLSCN